MKNLKETLEKALENSCWDLESINGNIITFYCEIVSNYDMTTEIEASTLQEVVEQVKEKAEMDVDYEASIWIGKDGHGINGAPYHIKDIVQEIEDYVTALEELAETLEGAL